MNNEKLTRCNMLKEKISQLEYALEVVKGEECKVKLICGGHSHFILPCIYEDSTVKDMEIKYTEAVLDATKKLLDEVTKQYEEE